MPIPPKLLHVATPAGGPVSVPPPVQPKAAPVGTADAPLPASPAVALVPLDAPFVEGRRYSVFPATELATRLDLFTEDPGGPYVRKHGVLILTHALPPATRC